MKRSFGERVALKLKTIFKTPALWKFLMSTEPVSREFGSDRGQPMDRYYIEAFLQKNQADICGEVLEVGDSQYSHQFGQDVQNYHVLHVDASQPGVTLVGDLAKPETLPENQFDCFICTQTFQYIYELDKGIQSAWKMLKPGGVLLATFPTVSQKSVGKDEDWKEYWRFTSDAVSRAFGDVFKKENIQVEAHGNALVGASFLMGLATHEISKAKRDVKDPDYQCLITLRAQKK